MKFFSFPAGNHTICDVGIALQNTRVFRCGMTTFCSECMGKQLISTLKPGVRGGWIPRIKICRFPAGKHTIWDLGITPPDARVFPCRSITFLVKSQGDQVIPTLKTGVCEGWFRWLVFLSFNAEKILFAMLESRCGMYVFSPAG